MIKDLSKMADLFSAEDLDRLNEASVQHFNRSNITFKVLDIDRESFAPNYKIYMRAQQGETLPGNYVDARTLVERTRHMFRPRLQVTYIMDVEPVVFTNSPTDDVDADWVRDHMSEYNVKVKEIAFHTGLDKTNISAWINGKRPMSQIVRALMFNFFKIYAIKQLLFTISSNNKWDYPYRIKNYFDKELIYAMVEKVNPNVSISDDGPYFKMDLKHDSEIKI